MTERLWPVLIAIAAISTVVLLPRLQVRSRRLFLLRVLCPSWRFFENIGVNSRLEVRWREAGGSWTEWRDALVAPQRSWTALFHNPFGNLHFAKQSAVEHLVSEAELRSNGIAESVPYAIVRRIAEECVRNLNSGTPSADVRHSSDAAAWAAAPDFQFKIVQVDAADGGCEDFLISLEHQLPNPEPRQ